MSEKKKLVNSDWIKKVPKGFSGGYTISQIRKIENCFDTCDDLLHQIGLSLNYSSKRSKFINAIEDVSVLIDYINELPYELRGVIDIPLKDSFNSGATETISRIHVEDIEISNTIGVKEFYGKYNSAKGNYVSGERTASKLKFKDFMGDGKIGGKYRLKFVELFKEDYETISKQIDANDKNGVLSYDKYIEYLIKDGEFDHKVNQPFKSFVSGLLDLTIIKPIIEACTGTDLITGEDLTDLERGLKGIGAVIDIFTFGQAITLAKGAEAGISTAFKTVAVEGLSNVAAYTTAEISQACDFPPLVTMILSLGTGLTASKIGSKYIIKDASGKVIEEVSDEVGSNIKNVSNKTNFENEIPRNGAEWEVFFKEKYGAENVVWVSKSDTSSKIYKDGFDEHLIKGTMGKGSKGVIGGHNFDEFKKALSDAGYDINDCIINIIEHPSIKGIYEIEYRIPARQYGPTGNLEIIPNQYKIIKYPKTVYEPSIISNEQMIQWGKDAMDSGVINGRNIYGYASNGLRFEGYIDETTGAITNFYPVVE